MLHCSNVKKLFVSKFWNNASKIKETTFEERPIMTKVFSEGNSLRK